MFERIIAALKKAGAENYIIRMTRTESSELFFIRRRRDITRAKDVTKYAVTVYRDFEDGGVRMRGASDFGLYPDMDDAEIEHAAAEAYIAAGYVKNPWFELPEPACGSDMCAPRDLARDALELAEGLFAADTSADAFINSAEIFAERSTVRVVSSRGADVSYSRCAYKGEMVAQCAFPQDVELYRDFEYDFPDRASLENTARLVITAVRDRARATEAPRAGEYSMIVSGQQLETLLSAYIEKSAASMIYAGYSGYSAGCDVQGANVTGEKLDMNLCAREPYSREGVPMTDRPLVRDGRLMTIHGSNRFCRYLGVEPTGDYEKFSLEAGTMPLEAMKKGKCIYPVAFSDFQMDSFTGRFGGEIRLAYLYDGGEMRIVTGGSVSGSLLEAQDDLVFSTEKYDSAGYSGPFAVLIKGVSVAGE